MEGIQSLFVLVLVFSVEQTYAQQRPSDFRVFTGSEALEQELGQNPEFQQVTARTGERVIINITGPNSLAVVQEGVNALLDCLPFLSMFPGGQITWLLQKIDQFGNLVGAQTAFVPPFKRIFVEGWFNRYLNITRTSIVLGAENPDSGIYTCRVCNRQGTQFEMCRDANTTVYLLGSPPDVDCGDPNDGTAWCACM